jgi:hypothetical protein
MAAERDSEIDWESELRLSQVDVDDAEDFQLSEVQKEFRFAPPVAVSIVDEYQRSRIPKATANATKWGIKTWQEWRDQRWDTGHS